MNKLRVGVIGCGSVVREIYQHLYFQSEFSALLEIAAVADPSPASRDWLGQLAGLRATRRYSDYQAMLAGCDLDAVQVNTPDHLHCAPTLAALAAGKEVIVPKPAAATIRDTHAMLQAARRSGRFLGIDFHKRQDPRIKEAAARFQSGRYGTFQAAVFYMLDKLAVADPNHSPRFFASADFAEKNSPISFLTVHMADALMHIVGLVPVRVRATSFAQKLPALRPIPVAGVDLVDTEIVFTGGALAHILTGWALPNTAWSTTVQSARLVCSEGLLELGLDTPGLREIHADGMAEINPLFRNFTQDGQVSGYGISSPGGLYRQALAWRNRTLPEAECAAALTPRALGFYSTLIVEAAERSLAQGERLGIGVVHGVTVDLNPMVVQELGANAANEYGYGKPAESSASLG